MLKTNMAKVAGLAIGATVVLGAFAPVASAVTVAELQAQINALMSQLSSLQGGTGVTNAISSDLTVGSSGNSVVVLQQALVAQGYLTMPSGVAMGYFGSLTKSGVMKWQAAHGVPSTGYFGPLSRASFNGSAGATGTVPGTTVGGSVSGSISTPGAEGTLTVTSAPVSNSTVYAGDVKATVLAFKAQANNSDVLVQRVKLNLGSSANVYNKVFSTVYLLNDSGVVVASSPMNSSTIVKEADGTYTITLSGFSSLVSKGTTRTFNVAMDLMPSIDSTYRTSYTLTLAASGVRAVDGAGISLYSPSLSTDVSRAVTVGASLVDSASLTVSADPTTPLAREVIASTGSSNNQADKVVLLTFNIRAEKADVNITDLKNFAVTASGAGTPATASTTYLYEGNGTGGLLLGSAALSGSTASFTNISTNVPKGTTKTYTIAADIQGATANQTTFAASLTGNTTNVIGMASNGTTIGTVSGTATGNNALVRNVGPIFTLNSAPTISYTAAAGVSGATSTAKATFKIHIKAVGADVEFGGSASTTYPLIGWGNLVAGTSTPIYFNGASSITVQALNVSSSTSLTIPASGLVTSGVGSNSYKLQQNNEADVTVDYVFEGRQSCGSVGTCTGTLISTGSYAVALERLNWLTSATGRQSTTFMVGDTNWRTGTVVMP